MLNNLKISQKLPALMVMMALIASFITGIISYNISATGLNDVVKGKIEALLSTQKTSMDYYLQSVDSDLLTLSTSDMTIQGLTSFEMAWDELRDPEKDLHKLYINDNPNPLGQKEKLDRAPDSSSYSAAHAHYHPWFRQLLQARGYYDIFLINHEGKVVYTVFKEEDYGTDILTGKWKDTGLGDVVKKVLNDFKPGKIAFSDFAPYAPSHDAPASFIATPIFDAQGEKHGVLVFQMPIDRINKIMQTNSGMGETGESYLVGSDLLMRSDSRLSKESTLLKTKVDTSSANKAIKGEEGIDFSTNYKGESVISGYEPLTFHGVTWGVITEKTEVEALEGIDHMANAIAIAVVLLSLVLSILGYFLIKGLIKDLVRTTNIMQRAANGDLNVRVIGITRNDELGMLQQAVNKLLDRTEAFTREAGAALKYAAKDEFFRTILPEGMVGSFARRAQIVNDGLKAMDLKTTTFEQNASSMGKTIREVVQSVLATVTEMQASAQSMSEISANTSTQSNVVADAAQSSAQNVESVAAATEEFSASISEVSQQVNRSAELSRTAVDRANAADKTIHTLSEAADRINQVVGLINDIADQTNLLALNATIEAARAGDAGKGFAVVAGEVKNLANQTARATQEIVQQIKGMQNATDDAVVAIGEVSVTINQVEESSAVIAEAIEQQRAAVLEISSSVQEGVRGVHTVAEIIIEVSEGANATSAASEQIHAASSELQTRAISLNDNLDQFLTAVTKQPDLEKLV
jgi:methyl-accepting chemotaxis protein